VIESPRAEAGRSLSKRLAPALRRIVVLRTRERDGGIWGVLGHPQHLWQIFVDGGEVETRIAARAALAVHRRRNRGSVHLAAFSAV